MSKRLFRFGVVAVMAFAGIASPVVVSAASQPSVVVDQVQTANLYNAGKDFTLTADAQQDVVVAGEDIVIDGNVGQNLIVAGANVIINGTVSGDVFSMSGGLVINGNVQGDVRALAGVAHINSAQIGGDLLVGGGMVNVSADTQVGGISKVSSGSYNQGTTNNPRTLAELQTSTTNFRWFDGRAGEVLLGVGAAVASIAVLTAVLLFVGGYLMQLFVMKVFPVISDQSITVMRREWIKSVLVGLGAMFAAPFVSLLLLISGIGVPLLGLLSILAILVLLFSMAYPSYILGDYLLTQLGRAPSGTWVKLAVGYVIFYLIFAILAVIPVIGWGISTLLSIGLTAWGIGGMLVQKWNKLQAGR